ncbi:hypothetical protein ACHAXA_009851, partial [Cyclostephanos tholiformis]
VQAVASPTSRLQKFAPENAALDVSPSDTSSESRATITINVALSRGDGSETFFSNTIKKTITREKMQIITLSTFMAVTIFRTDRFSPPFPMASRSTLGGALQMASDKPLTELCKITKEACEAVATMPNELYSQLKIGTGTSDTAAFKSDATFFTIATPYTVDFLVVLEEFEELVCSTLEKIKALLMTGNMVTILLGYNDEKGVLQAEIVYRPLTEPHYWASGTKSEGFKDGVLDTPKVINLKGLLITNGKVSPFIKSTIENSGMNMVLSLASGNSVLMLIEGRACAYIRDTGGFAKWDTSGPQAVLYAHGGAMAKLPEFLNDKSMVSYTHLKTKLNLDFCKK